jgi:prolipoprotein diacylglyceryltransferase
MPGTYVLIMLTACLAFAGAWCCEPENRAWTMPDWWKRVTLPLALFFGVTYGSKLPYVLAGSGWLSNGKSLTAGLAGGYIAVELVRFACRLPRAVRDSVALPLALALMVARWACFCDGCCGGTETALPWAVDFGDGIRRHPTQIYEMVFHGAMACLLLGYFRRQAFSGNRLRLYLLAYCVFRFATEAIRLEPRLLCRLTLSQCGVALLGGALAVQAFVERAFKPSPAILQREKTGQNGLLSRQGDTARFPATG